MATECLRIVMVEDRNGYTYASNTFFWKWQTDRVTGKYTSINWIKNISFFSAQLRKKYCIWTTYITHSLPLVWISDWCWRALGRGVWDRPALPSLPRPGLRASSVGLPSPPRWGRRGWPPWGRWSTCGRITWKKNE